MLTAIEVDSKLSRLLLVVVLCSFFVTHQAFVLVVYLRLR